MRSLRVVLAILVALVLTERDSVEDRTPRPDHAVTASCPKTFSPDLAFTPRQRLPFDFVAVKVIRCRWEARYLPGKGRWTVVIQEHADGPLDALMTELRRRSEHSILPVTCTMEAILVDYFVLVDPSGKAVLPAPPTGVCGKPFPSALDAVRRLPYRVDELTPIKKVESEKAFRAGCQEQYPDVLKRYVRLDGVRTRMWNPPPEGLRVCVFRSPEKTSDILPTARLESSRILQGGGLRTLLSALDTAPAGDCSSDHTRFAVLDPGFDAVHVQLDGCRSLLRPDGTLSRLTPEVVGLLTD
ncbi:hypothetical protein [Nonomuraea jabiensis]|uniref:hypothetical protein n=1 Tax=Nonomuraea jabiensis TaxID=882448 RepID=UPI0036C34101